LTTKIDLWNFHTRELSFPGTNFRPRELLFPDIDHYLIPYIGLQITTI